MWCLTSECCSQGESTCQPLCCLTLRRTGFGHDVLWVCKRLRVYTSSRVSIPVNAPCFTVTALIALVSFVCVPLCVLLFLPLGRQQLIAPGQVADCIYLISHGELEIFSRACPAGSDLSLSEPLISGLDMAQLQEQADADVWDSTPVSDISKEHGGG